MINTEGPYFRQVQLLCRLLPLLEDAPALALKGGTAINLFIRNMPRISVDLDFTFVPVLSRPDSLKAMTSILNDLGKRVRGLFRDSRIFTKPLDSQGNITKMSVRQGEAVVILEISPVLRGTLFPVEKMEIAPRARELFMFAAAQICSFADVFAGKICACLDRQHPRDLFDIKQLLDNEGLTGEVRRAFVVYLVCHSRPISELLDPTPLDKAHLFEEEFLGMTDSAVTYKELSEARDLLVAAIRKLLTREERDFIQSVAEGEPRYDLAPFPGLETFPALQWKVLNVRKMTDEKRRKEAGKIKEILQ